MRVLLITDWVANAGGVEAYVTWVREGLRAAGDRVKLLTSGAGTAAGGSADYVAYGANRFAAQALLQVANPLAVLRVRQAVRAFNPDVVLLSMFMHHLSPAILGQLARVPTVLSVADYKPVCPLGTKLLPEGSLCRVRAGAVCWRGGCVSLPHWLRDRPRYALLRRGLRRVDRVVTCSRWLQRELAENGVGADHLDWPVPAPSGGFSRDPAREPLFLYCGRLSVEKGVEVLLAAFARLLAEMPAARLRVAGEGPRRAELERMAGSLGVAGAVTFTGWLTPDDVERELARAWALVVPSLWAEPLGLAALEAIVRGVPVLASSQGGLGEIVEHGVTGLLVPNGDDAGLARLLEAVARGRAFPSRRLPEEAVRAVAQRHAVALHVAHLRGIFEQVAAPLKP